MDWFVIRDTGRTYDNGCLTITIDVHNTTEKLDILITMDHVICPLLNMVFFPQFFHSDQ